MSAIRLRCGALALVLLLTVAGSVGAQTDTPFLNYRTDSWLLPQSPGVTGGPVAGLFNPAAFALTDVGGSDFWWNDGNIRGGLDNYGLGFGRNLNFAMNTSTYGTHAESWKIYDYQVGLAGGTREDTFGIGYRWSRGETRRTAREHALVIGAVSRHRSWLSFGASAVLGLSSNAAQYVFDVGLRPFQKDFLTVYADWAVNDHEAFFQDGSWGAGVELRPIAGVHLGFKARERIGTTDVDYSALAGVTMGFTNFTMQPQYDTDGNLQRSHYLLRNNPPLKGFPGQGLVIGKKLSYYPLSLENKVLTYQKYRWFDDKRVAWLDLLPLLNAVRDDDGIDILVVDLAGFDGRPSLLWEFRQKLLEIEATGKEVIIHTDRTNTRSYYLASAATTLSIDPFGSVSIPGLALSRSYLKGTLEKLGIGFQAHRYYKYKSAVETLSRDSMSAADREQRQRIVDVLYEEPRNGMAEGRHLSESQMDQLTDDKGELRAQEAVDAGLVDRIARWDAVLKELHTQRGARPARRFPLEYNRRYWDNQWGQPVKIPVVYAVGPCAMDEGIKGRKTSAYLRGLVRDPDVAAVVLRADSPGGDPLPSDLIAEAVRMLKEAGKPVIVSQGDVAASGGYWISMDGTEILTTPLTITGSIGVISGWVWDDGIAAKAGVTSAEVHRGQHATLYSQVNLPFLGSIPRRPMNEFELGRTEEIIRGMYDDFVNGVAEGRNLDPAQVHEVAQGRVWMGGDAIERGLCDSFGSLDDAINLAREKAGVADWREIEIVEYPPRPLVQFPSFGPRLPVLFGLGARVDQFVTWVARTGGTGADAPATVASPIGAPGLSGYDVDYLRSLVTTRGQASLLVAPDMVPEAWQGK